MDHLRQDLRYAIRSLFRQPTFALTAILTLALGIGSTTAMFGVVNGVLIRPLPFPDAGRIVAYAEFFSGRAWVHVHPDHRGLWIGAAVLGWTESRARELGSDALVLGKFERSGAQVVVTLRIFDASRQSFSETSTFSRAGSDLVGIRGALTSAVRSHRARGRPRPARRA